MIILKLFKLLGKLYTTLTTISIAIKYYLVHKFILSLLCIMKPNL